MPDNEPYDDMNEMNEGEPPYGMFGLDISKIKIGRIDFTIDNSKNNDKEWIYLQVYIAIQTSLILYICLIMNIFLLFYSF